MGTGDAAVLSNHAEVMMHDLAAGLLLELERLMLTSTAAGVDLATALDTAAEFQAAPGAASALEAVSNRLYNDDVRFFYLLQCELRLSKSAEGVSVRR